MYLFDSFPPYIYNIFIVISIKIFVLFFTIIFDKIENNNLYEVDEK